MSNSTNFGRPVYLIGHVSADFIDNAKRMKIGGGVSYMGEVFNLMGWKANIVTKLPQNYRFIEKLKELGITVHNLPIGNESNRQAMTKFKISYDGLERQIFLKDRQEDITERDVRAFARNIPPEALVVVAPVMNEVDMNIIPFLYSRRHPIIICPQGYFRGATAENRIYQKPNDDIKRVLKYARMAIFSREDIGFISGKKQDKYIRELAEIAPVFVTDGENGSAFYFHETEIHVKAFPLREGETGNLTGAGDVYAASLIHSLLLGEPLVMDMEFASVYSAIKINKEGGVGQLPDGKYVEKFVEMNERRIEDYAAWLLYTRFGREFRSETSN